MQPVTFVVSLCKLYAVGLILCSKIADVHGIEVNDVLTLEMLYDRLKKIIGDSRMMVDEKASNFWLS